MGITRAEVLHRAATIWPDQTVPYNMGKLHANGWRTDCSGFVSMCWNIPASIGHDYWGGLDTVTLQSSGLAIEIGKDALQPGDAIGFLGPGSGGADGHVVLFAAWVDGNRVDYWAYEQHGPTDPPAYGPVHRILRWGRPKFKAYQYRDIADGGAPGVVPPPWPGRIFRYTPGQPVMAGEDIKQWQQQMRSRGWRDRNGNLLEADGEYGELSADVCRKFEQQKGLEISGEVGPIDWAAAWTAPVTPD